MKHLKFSAKAEFLDLTWEPYNVDKQTTRANTIPTINVVTLFRLSSTGITCLWSSI